MLKRAVLRWTSLSGVGLNHALYFTFQMIRAAVVKGLRYRVNQTLAEGPKGPGVGGQVVNSVRVDSRIVVLADALSVAEERHKVFARQ
jgi:hypothetical protein